MSLETIEGKLHQKSDMLLRKKLEDSTLWVWDETGHSIARPSAGDLGNLNAAMNGTGLPQFTEIPWIGAARKQFIETSFLYLRDTYRNRAVYEFMQHVEAVQDIANERTES